MMVSPAPASFTSPMMVEGALTAILMSLAFLWPRVGSHWSAYVTRVFESLARKRGLSVAVVGFTALLSRLAMLPLCPIPQPYIPDDFSFMLAANTFASGRLTNPTPAMWIHFETIHVSMWPTYMSMYFPAQGMLLAAGKVLFGHPWYGLLCVTALMCAAVCWMLQAWLPPTWALLGALLVVLRIGLFSFWINTYTGAGSVAALGGALVLGALPRFMRKAHMLDGLLLAAGIVILATSRPFEGMLLCLPVIAMLVRWFFTSRTRPTNSALLRRVALPLILLVAGASWLGFYDARVNGNPLKLPYTINRSTYAVAPYWIWQSPRPEPAYHYEVMRDFYARAELNDFLKGHSPRGFLIQIFGKILLAVLFFGGLALLPGAIMIRRVWHDKRTRFLVICLLVMAAGTLFESFFFPYYIAPFTAAITALGVQALRHLNQWKPGGKPIGSAMVRLSVALCIGMAALRLWAELAHWQHPSSPGSAWGCECYTPSQFNTSRARLEEKLEHMPGRQLVIVRYTPHHEPMKEWVYNEPDIENSKVLWAREMDTAKNLELIHFYPNRQVWLVEPDTQPDAISPYRAASP